MRHRHLTAALAATATLATTALAAPAAHASLSQELHAGNRVERILTRKYPQFDFTANCDTMNPGRFWCSVSGHNGNWDCFRSGHADVRAVRRGYTVTWDYWLYGLTRNCF